MEEKGIPPDVFSYNPLITDALLSNDTARAQRIFAKMIGQGVRPNHVTYYLFVKRCAKAGDLDGALALVEEMKQKGIAPTPQIYNSVLLAMAKMRSTAECLDYLKGEVEANGVRPDAGLYNLVLDTVEDASARALFEKMEAEGVEPNLATYNLTLEKASRAGDLAFALTLLEKMRAHEVHPTQLTYRLGIAAMVAGGNVDGALALFADMEAHNVEPDPYIYYQLVQGCADAGRKGECLRFFAESKARAKPDPRAYNVALAVLAEADAPCEELFRTLAAMRADAYYPASAAMHEVQQAVARKGNVEEKLRLYHAITAFGSRPTRPFLDSLVGNLAREGREEEYKPIVEECAKRGTKLADETLAEVRAAKARKAQAVCNT